MSKHKVPVTLRHDGARFGVGACAIVDEEGYSIETVSNSKTDKRGEPGYRDAVAQEIVHRYNSHPALLAALKDAALWACQDRIASGIGRRKATDTVRFLQGALQRIQDAAAAAIKAAKVDA